MCPLVAYCIICSTAPLLFCEWTSTEEIPYTYTTQETRWAVGGFRRFA